MLTDGAAHAMIIVVWVAFVIVVAAIVWIRHKEAKQVHF
jgi:hypothetical protein